MAVINMGKELLFRSAKNYGVRATDKFALTVESACEGFYAEPMALDELLNVPVLFDDSAAHAYNICYQFNGRRG